MSGQAWRASVGKGKTEVIPGDAAEDRVTGHGDCHIWGPEDICPFTHPEHCLSTPRADTGWVHIRETTSYVHRPIRYLLVSKSHGPSLPSGPVL